jgi:anaerobic magnesium-protoporphyrin IX monomethyl ester cyclase
MTTLLTHGYFLADDAAEQRVMKPYPPLGILYISAYLREHGLENSIFDTTFSTRTALEEHLVRTVPGVVALYINLMTKLSILRIIRFIRSEPSLAATRIILGGPEVRAHVTELLEHGADAVVIGEGEVTTLELLRSLAARGVEGIGAIDGIGYRSASGEIVLTPERTLMKDIDALPLPNRAGIDLAAYQRAWKERHGRNAISVSTMRGCPYTCKWCSRGVYGLTYRRRSPEAVARELKALEAEYHPDTIWFVDDVFTISHEWLKGFAAALEREQVSIPYECITRADRMNEEVVRQLKASGCYRVWIGAESGSQRVIDAMDRRVKVEQVREMIGLCKQHGIETGTFIMLGYPGETEADIEETINHLKRCAPDLYTITVAYPIKGTEFFQEIEARMTGSFDWETQTDRQREFVRTYPRRYYDFAVRRVVNEMAYHTGRRAGGAPSRMLVSKSKSIAAKACMWWVRNAP